MANGILSLIQPGGSSGDKYNMRSDALFHFNVAATATSPTSGEVGKDSNNNLVFVHDNIVSVPIGMIISFISPISVSTPKVFIKNNSTLLNTTAISITDTNGDAGLIANRWYIIVYDGSIFRVVNSHISTNISDNNNQPASTSAVKTYVDGLISNRFKYTISNSTGTTPNTTKYNGSAGTLAPSASTEYIIYLVKHEHTNTDVYDEWITIKNGSNYTWEKIGNTDMDISGLLANISDHTFTPSGTVSKPTFSGNSVATDSKGAHTHSVTAKGSVTSTFSGNTKTISGTTAGHEHSIAKSGISVSASYQPTGTVSQPTFSGNSVATDSKGAHTHTITAGTVTSTGSYQPTGTVSQPSFKGNTVTITSNLEADYNTTNAGNHSHSIAASTITSTGTYQPTGSVSSTFSGNTKTITSTNGAAITVPENGAHTHTIDTGAISLTTTYTPAGTISKPSVTVSNGDVTKVTSVGAASAYTVSNEILTLTPSKVPSITAKTVTAALSATPAFTGTAANISMSNTTQITSSSNGGHTHTIAKSGISVSASYQPTGTVSSSFTGNSKTVSVSNTATTTGEAGTHQHTISTDDFKVVASYQPAGTVTKPTFSGNTATISVTNAVATTASNGAHTHNVTATGSVSQPTFSGDTKTITSTNGAAVKVASATDTISISYQPTGSVSSTFTGESATTNSTGAHTHNVTATGTISQPTFTGTAVTLTHTQD
jgi:hypothetical protein